MGAEMNDELTVKRRGGFTVVPNSVVADEKLSIEARGLFAYLMSLPDGWVFRTNHLKRVYGVGRDKYYRLVRELKERGYLVVKVPKDSLGRFIGTHWEICDEPGITENPDADSPDSGKSDLLENKDSLETLKGISVQSNCSADNSSSRLAKDSTLAEKRNGLDGFFDEFWRSHPRPKDRSRTSGLFERAVNESFVEPGQLVKAARLQAAKYQKDRTPKHFMNTSVSGLDQRMWEDFANKAMTSKADVARYYADRIDANAYIHPGSINGEIAREMMRLGLTNSRKLEAYGVTVAGEGGSKAMSSCSVKPVPSHSEIFFMQTVFLIHK